MTYTDLDPKTKELVDKLVKENVKAYDQGCDLMCNFIIEALKKQNKIMLTFYEVESLIRKVQKASKEHSKMVGL